MSTTSKTSVMDYITKYSYLPIDLKNLLVAAAQYYEQKNGLPQIVLQLK